MDLLTQAYEERQGRGEGVAGGVNTFMHWHFTSACMRPILACNALGTTLKVAEANFSYPACGATEILYIKISSLSVSIHLSLFKDGRIIKCLITEKRHQNIMVNCSITCYYSWAMYSTNGPFYARFRDHPGNKVFVSRKRLLVKT